MSCSLQAVKPMEETIVRHERRESHNTRDGSFEVIQTDELVRTENSCGCPEKKKHGFIADLKEKFEEVKEKIGGKKNKNKDGGSSSSETDSD
ncbi:hypothetical protein QJS04_geneDACA011083 [Acorus gramineus]|uniref:Uncharacterized protein n=1 Tax=Acorus gramineus TaxID=55184 RepID=A0AAV9BKU6_ACOGR|nr:hypothetical protein QJS04_geneDACA011083 [Acorus gramineus]